MSPQRATVSVLLTNNICQTPLNNNRTTHHFHYRTVARIGRISNLTFPSIVIERCCRCCCCCLINGIKQRNGKESLSSLSFYSSLSSSLIPDYSCPSYLFSGQCTVACTRISGQFDDKYQYWYTILLEEYLTMIFI